MEAIVDSIEAHSRREMTMNIAVNGVTIPRKAIEAEAAYHTADPQPDQAAARALAVRELLLQRARALGLGAEGAAHADDCDALIDELLGLEAPVPEPTEEECLRFYESNSARFSSGELVEASHILFAVVPHSPVDALRVQAESTLVKLTAEPELFAHYAGQLSNCPSGAHGGNLGQIQCGELAPEFEQAVFGTDALGVLPRLVTTRFGFHIVFIERRLPGRSVDFATARPRIAERLSAQVRARAAHQYVRMLAAAATIDGVDLQPASSPLIQ
jgi:peptidyl-prolyl cis-trans isomerase C